MKDIKTYFAEYAEFHKNPTNQMLHVIGIPLIMFSLLGLLRLVSIPMLPDFVTAGFVLWAVATLWYFLLSPKLCLLFSPVAYAMYWASQYVPVEALWVVFIVGWIIQLYGHKKHEQNSPAFVQNIEHLLVGPLWIFVKVFKVRY